MPIEFGPVSQGRAEALFARIADLLRDAPGLSQELSRALTFHPDRVTLAIAFDGIGPGRIPVVVAFSPFGNYPMVPMNADTLEALSHLVGGDDRKPFDIVTSSGKADELISLAGQMQAANGGRVEYDPKKVAPQDFIAMAIFGLTGGINGDGNEPFSSNSFQF